MRASLAILIGHFNYFSAHPMESSADYGGLINENSGVWPRIHSSNQEHTCTCTLHWAALRGIDFYCHITHSMNTQYRKQQKEISVCDDTPVIIYMPTHAVFTLTRLSIYHSLRSACSAYEHSCFPKYGSQAQVCFQGCIFRRLHHEDIMETKHHYQLARFSLGMAWHLGLWGPMARCIES